MNILVACEESQAVTKKLRELGHRAFSCDYKNVLVDTRNGILKEIARIY